MNLLCLVVPLLAASPLLQQGFQDSDVDNLHFHRIHLTNGNFIDGQILKETTSSILLRLRAGEMTIRRDMVNRVEYVKMRDRKDSPTLLDNVFKKPEKKEEGKEEIDRTTVTVDAPDAVRKKVDLILFKFKNTPGHGDEREIPFQEIAVMGEEAAVYLASRVPAFDIKTQDAIGVALINLNNLKRSAKVDKILEGYLSHDAPAVRAVSVNVLSTGASEANKLRLFKSMLKDRDRSVRITLMSCLGSVEDREWFDILADVSADPDADIRSRALRILRSLAEKHELKEELAHRMVSNLRAGESAVQIDALRAIGLLGQKEAWKDVTPMLRSSDPPVRVAAAQTLTTLAAPEAGPDLVEAAGNEQDRAARGALAGTLQKLRPIKAVEPVIQWLKDGDEETQKLAEVTLRIITGENLGADADKWLEWWNKNKPN